MNVVHGRQMKAGASGLRCDLKAPGHNNLIPPGKTYYKVQTGIAQGTFHNVHCYQAARRQYEAAQKTQEEHS